MKRVRQNEHVAASAGGERENHIGTRGHGGARTMALLRDIQAGQANPETITIDDRRLIVAYLMSDGYSTAEIAQMLKLSDRSIERDKRAIREGNALPKDPQLVGQLAGRLYSEAELAVQRIRRISREKLTPAPVKVDAEHRCFQILSELVQRLQGLGYLPTATQRIEAELHHQSAEVPSMAVLEEELNRLCKVSADQGGSVPPQIHELRAEFQRATIAMKVQRASSQRSLAEGGDG